MLKVLAAAAVLGLACGPALAGTFERCTREQAKVAGEAIDGAADLALYAAAAVGDTPDYARWFGPFSAQAGEVARANLKAVRAALLLDDVIAVCLSPAEVDCKEDTYAYVLFDRPRAVYLCPVFFAMPAMADAIAGRGDTENGTREGTFIHELSHFPAIAGTEDHCYARGACEGMAARDRRRAIDNADSYQYFSEDAMATYVAKLGSGTP